MYTKPGKWKILLDRGWDHIYIYMSHIREASKVTVNSSHFHPAHQHYTDEAHKAETVPSVYIYIYIYTANSIKLVLCKP